MDERTLPVTDDHDSAGHWDAARRGELAVRACMDCDALLHLPKAYCHHCGSWNTTWRSVVPAGTLYSFTVTMRELRVGFEPPYTVVVVALTEDPLVRLFGFLPGQPALTIGMPMTARFEQVNDDVTLVQWDPE